MGPASHPRGAFASRTVWFRFVARLLVLTPIFISVLVPTTALAQSQKVLKGKEITESALVEALTPDPERSTRSILVKREGSSPAANLLITFETDSAELTRQAKRAVNTVGRALNSNQLSEFRFAIEGHADPRGDAEHNLKLSQARAESVTGYLERTHHIGPERLQPVGKGEAELMNTANPFAEENRRVTIRTLPKK